MIIKNKNRSERIEKKKKKKLNIKKHQNCISCCTRFYLAEQWKLKMSIVSIDMNGRMSKKERLKDYFKVRIKLKIDL